jgi:hypothetical protein
MPSATYGVSGIMSSMTPVPSVSAPRPYAGPSVISGSNRVEVSIAISTIGVLVFLLTLV